MLSVVVVHAQTETEKMKEEPGPSLLPLALVVYAILLK